MPPSYKQCADCCRVRTCLDFDVTTHLNASFGRQHERPDALTDLHTPTIANPASMQCTPRGCNGVSNTGYPIPLIRRTFEDERTRASQEQPNRTHRISIPVQYCAKFKNKNALCSFRTIEGTGYTRQTSCCKTTPRPFSSQN